MMLILPMGVFAQNLKFGHINAMEIVSAMPEYTKAQSELQALNKQLGQDLQRSQEEFSKKYQEFMQQKDSLPAVIAERRQKSPGRFLREIFCLIPLGRNIREES